MSQETSPPPHSAAVTEQVPLLPHRPDPALLESFRYINAMPGKNVRGKMIDCFQLWLNIDESSTPKVLESIKEIIGDLHNASLMIDDIEDNSKLRRGIPVAHSIFGVPAVINGANYAYFLALEKCHALRNPQAMDVFVGELLNLHRGQGHDILWRDDVRCPTEEQYLEMVKDKTGGLFRLAVGLMQAFATTNQTTDFTSLVNNLALYFQIRDDYINLVDEEYMKSKSFCEDLTEGKFSFPIIHCIRSDPNDHRLLSILKKKTEDVDVKRYAQQLMFGSGSMEYTRDKCIRLKDEIVSEVKALGGNPPLLKLVEALDVQIQDLKTSPKPPELSSIDVA
mmetsp:Transcript_21877/g.40832  ORF Transcript_21877/g.40832 Transcript_21877/m.40832 type:complete len:337 (-) Transcript_21877:93-1103(-)